MKQKKSLPGWLTRLGQYLLMALGLALMALVLWRLFPNLFSVLRTGDVDRIEEYLRGSNRVACLAALTLMSVIQVISVVIPALPIRIAAGAVLDLLPGFLVSWGGFVFANFCAFEVIRHLGGRLHDAVHHFVQESKLAAPLRKLMDTDNSAVFVAVANIIPFLPNGIIPYAAAMTDLGVWQFLGAVALGSALPALADCALGDAILSGNLLAAGLCYAALFALAFLLYKKRRALADFLDRFPGSAKGGRS